MHLKTGMFALNLRFQSVILKIQHISSKVVRHLYLCGNSSLFATFENHTDVTIISWLSTTTEAHHRFTPEEQDWGFTRFVDLKKLFQPDPARGRPIIENDETVVTAFVRVLKDPTGVLWHNWHK